MMGMDMMLNRIVHLKNTRRVRFNLTFYFLFLILLLPFSSLQADPGFWILQAQKRLQLGDRRGALEAFQKASWEMPQDANIHYNMGVLSESIDRDEEAVSHYSSYLRWQPGAEDRGIVKNKIFILCGRLGAEAYKNTRYHEAVEWYYKAKELYPNAKAVYYNLSRVYQVMGNHQVGEVKFSLEIC